MIYFSLGSNLGNRKETILRAIDLLSERVGVLVACSAFVESEALGFDSENKFLNLAACFENGGKSSEEILGITESIERELGRKQKSIGGRHFDRCIDIDLLFLDQQIVDTSRLKLPHPRLQLRRFVLEPLAEIAPDFIHPTLQISVKTMLKQLNRASISRLEEATPATAERISHLLKQLTSNPPEFGVAKLTALIHTPLTHLFVLRDEEGCIQGMATLCLCSAPTGMKAWIEDVVVDSACRGRGYGRQLIEQLCNTAFAMNAKCVMLTSRPSRVAANALYRSLGFEQRETNVYRLKNPSR